MNDNSQRLVDHITKLFDEFYKEAQPKDPKCGKALAGLRQLIYRSIGVFLGEAEIAKKYGVPVDALSLVSFADADWPPTWAGVDSRNSWIPIPSERDRVRPAGITNEEYSDYLVKLRTEFGQWWEKEKKQRIQQPNVISNENFQALWQAIEQLFRDAFLAPVGSVPFQAGTYVRITVGTPATIPLVMKEDLIRQNVPCQVCGENRATDACHVIPRSIGGSSTIDNILLLCPTHHALLDRGMLSRDEWEKIDWSVKNRKSHVYAMRVLKQVHDKFWAKVDAGVYEKKHEGSPKGSMRTFYSEYKDEIENGNGT